MPDFAHLDQITEECLLKAFGDKPVDLRRRRMFGLSPTPAEAPTGNLLAAIPSAPRASNLPATTSETQGESGSPWRGPSMGRRTFTGRAAGVVAHALKPAVGEGLIGKLLSKPEEDPKTTAARQTVSDFLGSKEFEGGLGYKQFSGDQARKLTEAFKLHPDYEQTGHHDDTYDAWGRGSDTFAHKGGEHNVNLERWEERKGERPALGQGSVNSYIHDVTEHPEYDQALNEKAHRVWSDHLKNGNITHYFGNDRSNALVSGTKLLEGGSPSSLEVSGDHDVDGNPIDPKKLYEHDWNDTGDIFPVKGPDDVKRVLHGQIQGSLMKKNENIRDVVDDLDSFTV